jgi:signal transduction histidine kinase
MLVPAIDRSAPHIMPSRLPALFETLSRALQRRWQRVAATWADLRRDRRLLRLLCSFGLVVVAAITATVGILTFGSSYLDAAFTDVTQANEFDEEIDEAIRGVSTLRTTAHELSHHRRPIDHERWRRDKRAIDTHLRELKARSPGGEAAIAIRGAIAAAMRYDIKFAAFARTLNGADNPRIILRGWAADIEQVKTKRADAKAALLARKAAITDTLARLEQSDALFDAADTEAHRMMASLARLKHLTQVRIGASDAAYTQDRDLIRRTILILVLATFASALAASAAIVSRLLALLHEAEVVGRTKGEFLSMMGHELRTPLNAVIGFLGLMRNEVFGPIGNNRYKVYVGLMHHAAHDLLTLVNNLLDLSHVDTNTHVVPQPVTARDLIAAAMTFLTTARDMKPIAVSVNAAPDIAVNVDAAMLTKALIAIIGNAIKFTPDAGSVAITAERRAGRIALAVQDTGIGIPAALIDRVTEPFFQVDRGNTRRFDGGGIGLSVASQLVELNGGELTIESEFGKGTTVTLLLPAATAVEPKAQAA